MRPVTRCERRAERQRRYATTREVRLAAGLEHRVSGRGGASRAIDYEAPPTEWLRSLDYRVSGESGALETRPETPFYLDLDANSVAEERPFWSKF